MFPQERGRQEALTNRFQVRGIPCLIILSPTGEIISRIGVQEIMINGAQFIRQWSESKCLGFNFHRINMFC